MELTEAELAERTNKARERITQAMDHLAECGDLSPELSEAWADMRMRFINGQPVTEEERANFWEQLAVQFGGLIII